MQALCDSIVFQAVFDWNRDPDHQKRLQTLRSLEIEVTIKGYGAQCSPCCSVFFIFLRTEALALPMHYSTHTLSK